MKAKKENKAQIQIINEWSDDHCPCVSFKYKGVEFELWWTSREAESALEYSNESKSAKKKIAGLIEIIEHPDTVQSDDDDEEPRVTCYTDWGCLMFNRPKPKRVIKGK